MNRFIRHFALCATIMLSCGSVVSAAPRAPTGKWIVNFAESQCNAHRDYGPAGEPLHLVIRPSPDATVIQLLVIRNGKAGESIQLPATLQIDDHPPINASLLAFGSKEEKIRTNVVNLPAAVFAPIRQATRISISAKRELDEAFSLSQMSPLLAAIDDCLADLQRVWNIGEANSAKVATHAKANLAKYFSNKDYPGVAVMNRQSGEVGFRLLVNEKGKVADCMLVETSGVAALDAQSCAILMSRAKFEPAIGVDGKPAKDAVVGRIRWKMPN